MTSIAAPSAAMLVSWAASLEASRRLRPAVAARLLAVVIVAECLGFIAVLTVLGVDLAADHLVPPQIHDAHVVPPDHPVWVTALVLGALVGTVVRTARAWRPDGGAGVVSADLGGSVAVIADERPLAFAVPADTGGRGTVVVTSALVDALRDDELRALVAHEEAHLRNRHHRLLWVARIGEIVLPLLAPLAHRLRDSAENWADDEAARSVGDRTTVARAVARSALVQAGARSVDAAHDERGAERAEIRRQAHGHAVAPSQSRPSPTVDIGGPTTRRVARLLHPPPGRVHRALGVACGISAFVAAGVVCAEVGISAVALVSHLT